MRFHRLFLAGLSVALVLGCPCGRAGIEGELDAGVDGGPGPTDAGPGLDAEVLGDGGGPLDAGDPGDANGFVDAGPADAGGPVDAGGPADAGRVDAGAVDGGAACRDIDLDTYFGPTAQCPTGTDCDDNDPFINPGVILERCNNKDDNCNNSTDENVPTQTCSSACGTGTATCTGGQMVCNAPAPKAETCNNQDDDCNGRVDDAIVVNCSNACGAGWQTCQGGTLSACSGRQPTSELCSDGADNDCDGFTDTADPDCGVVAPAAVYVSTAGPNANVGCGTAPATACQTIAAGLREANSAGRPRLVHVATGVYVEDPQITSGVVVLGGWNLGFTARAPTTNLTTIRTSTAAGVTFGAGATASTVLDGFAVQVTGVPGGTDTAAITISNASPIVSGVAAVGGSGLNVASGVRILGGGAITPPTPVLKSVTAVGGSAAQQSIGLACNQASPRIEGGIFSGDQAPSGIGIYLEACAGTQLIAVTASGGQRASNISTGVRGFGGATVTNSNLEGGAGPTESRGVHWSGSGTVTLVDNTLVGSSLTGGGGTASASAAVRIDSATVPPVTVRLYRNRINGQGRAGGSSAGVAAIAGQGEIADNFVRGGVGCGPNTAIAWWGTGVTVGTALFLITRNTIVGALDPNANNNCLTIGVHLSQPTASTVTNNVIFGGTGSTAEGLRWIIDGASAAEPVIHSNTVNAEGRAGTTTNNTVTRALVPVGRNNPPAAGRGIVRNNILSAGTVANANRSGVRELNNFGGCFNAGRPRIFENNDLYGSAGAGALYVQCTAFGGTNTLNTIPQVNALTQPVSSGNINASPQLVNEVQDPGGPPPATVNGNFHLGSTASPCYNAGTASGGTGIGPPGDDIDRQTRPRAGGYDIGADEL